MDFEADRDTSPVGDPSLTDMARKAVGILRKNPKGFVLFVESKLLLTNCIETAAAQFVRVSLMVL